MKEEQNSFPWNSPKSNTPIKLCYKISYRLNKGVQIKYPIIFFDVFEIKAEIVNHDLKSDLFEIEILF